jgi:hypothetical protein
MRYFGRVGRHLGFGRPPNEAPSDPKPHCPSELPAPSEEALPDALGEQTADTLPMIHLDDSAGARR